MEDKWRERGCSGGVKDSWGGGGGEKAGGERKLGKEGAEESWSGEKVW